MTVTSPASDPFATPDLDRAIAEAESTAVVGWRAERIPFREIPERIARIDPREDRDRLYGGWVEVLEALNPRYEERLAAWTAGGDVISRVAERGPDPRQLAVDLERLVMHGETPYYAALRRYLAVIGIEQGDATEADLWHVVRGGAWSQWFGPREVGRAVTAAGRSPLASDLDGWRAAEAQLAGAALEDSPVARAVAEAYATLVGSPEWLSDELRMVPDEVIPFADFAAFVRLWRVRRAIGLLQVELRIYASDDPAVHRAYYSGIVGHLTGVAVNEEGYLHAVGRPFESVERIGSILLGAMLVESLEQRHGLHWWRSPDAGALVERVGSAAGIDDAVAELGYDAWDWRPVLRQIRTRLIGEMSGYGGPNITTRAGTRKV